MPSNTFRSDRRVPAIVVDGMRMRELTTADIDAHEGREIFSAFGSASPV